MKKVFTIYMLLVTFFIAYPAAAETLTILHLHDTHSNLFAGGPRDNSLVGQAGGVARAATIIGQTRISNPNTLVFHGGDFSIGDIPFCKYTAVPELRLMSSLKFDAIALGNHEFDLTPRYLQLALDTAFNGVTPVPMLSSNLILNPNDLSTAKLKNYVRTYTIINKGSVKIGVFGMTTPETNLLSQPAPDSISSKVIDITTAVVLNLRAQGCDIVIMLSHLGYAVDKVVSANIPGIDVILSAHDHIFVCDSTTNSGGTTYIFQNGAFYRNIGKIDLVINNKKITKVNYRNIELDNTITEEPTVAGQMEEMKSDLEIAYNKPFFTQKLADVSEFIGESADSLFVPDKDEDTPVGNLVADIYKEFGKTDIAIVPGGTTSQPLYKGPIVADDIYRMIGYGSNSKDGLGFRIATFRINGQALLGIMNGILSMINVTDDYLIQGSGLTYKYKISKVKDKTTLSLINESVQINGSAIDPTKQYTVTANEFVLKILSAMNVPFETIKIYDNTEFEVVTAAVTGKTLTPKVEGRVKSVGEDKITIVHLHDTHSNLFDGGPRDTTLKGTIGGAARAAAVISKARKDNPNTIVLHGGDFSIGDIPFCRYIGVPELQLMKQLGVDACVLGNHEFDLTPGGLQTELETAFQGTTPVPMLCANIYLNPNDTLGPNLKNYITSDITKTYGNVKMGIFGMTTPETNLISKPGPDSIDMANIPAIVLSEITKLKNAGCDAIIMLSHLGYGIDKQISTQVPGIDIILSAHDHIFVNDSSTNPGGMTYIFQQSAFFRNLGKIDLTFTNKKLTGLQYRNIELNTSIQEDKVVADAMNLLKDTLEKDYKIPFFSQKAATAADFFREEADSMYFSYKFQDTPIGDLVADIYKKFGKTDIAILPGGSTAQPLYKGPIVADDIYRMISYGYNTANGLGFHVAAFKIRGDTLLKAMDFIISQVKVTDDFLIQTSGMKYKYKLIQGTNDITLKLIPASVMINGKPIKADSNYTVTSNEFVLGILSSLGFSFQPVEISDKTEFEVVYGAIKDSTIVPKTDGRVQSDTLTITGIGDVEIPAKNMTLMVIPNPCADNSIVSANITDPGYFIAKVYNSEGFETAEIYSGWLDAGLQVIRFNTNQLTNGIYMMKLSSGTSCFIAKFIVVH